MLALEENNIILYDTTLDYAIEYYLNFTIISYTALFYTILYYYSIQQHTEGSYWIRKNTKSLTLSQNKTVQNYDKNSGICGINPGSIRS